MVIFCRLDVELIRGIGLCAGAAMDSHLSEDKQLRVRSICKSGAFQENCGRTNILEHNVIVGEISVPSQYVQLLLY